MARTVAAVSAVVLSAALTGCGAAPDPDPAALGARIPELRGSMLGPDDVPGGLLPAADQAPVSGMRSAGRDCARLLRIADALDSRRFVPRVPPAPSAAVAFYSAEPALTFVEHGFRLPPGEAARQVAAARSAAAGCPRVPLNLGGGRSARLRRDLLFVPRRVADAVAVRYWYGTRSRWVGVQILVARFGADLLVLTAPGDFSRGGDRLVETVASRALAKARAAHGGEPAQGDADAARATPKRP
ncbi:hypothetical protein [Actinomadura atramentaria]|uniref:hypothetical protein n=1 Tax=Actinomadura atramentaria TaxID=1990 RepID=UPI0003604FDC|nr:hypothetical protein [Actinomadura atramentaria]